MQFILSLVHKQLSFLAVGVVALIFSGISLYRAITFYRWFFDSVFLEALNYGSNISEVLDASKAIVVSEGIKKKPNKLQANKK